MNIFRVLFYCASRCGSVTPLSEVRMDAMLVLLMVVYCKYKSGVLLVALCSY